ncbi:hypothetical protein GCM10010503_20880 [Streptomyces lucensis JCM 4490]|uniref:SEFIR domain-containing protein n=1 Tax=Streptomyces lucensis JCM 4490 TaxID=1306176 RepID=A0A918J3V4_9ACTN|nr:toll/interleukin-1 receptor domain-containing protein [Streptomyces lucensis]GGW44010.1 hypothetical protein GCM10010503_20880 [Streptomyces lucensis JCM 4490]
MASCFVTSFAAAENPAYAARFHDDLAEEVSRLLGRKVDARKCDHTLSADERGSLVAEAGVLVVLCSPDYYLDEGCLDDWKLFQRRLDHVPARRRPARPPERVLVRWHRIDELPGGRPRPPMLTGDVMAPYNKVGLYRVVRNQGPDSSAYRHVLRELAAAVRKGLTAALPPLPAAERVARTAPLPPPRQPSVRTSLTAAVQQAPQTAVTALRESAPLVFVSYAHDDARHSAEVSSLAQLLKDAGLTVVLDQDVAHEPQIWLRWMADNLEAADFILTVASPAYRRRLKQREQPGKGMGATWEGGYVLDQVYGNPGTWQKRILRVLFPRFGEEALPDFPGSRSATVYLIDPVTGQGDLDQLLGYLRRGSPSPL